MTAHPTSGRQDQLGFSLLGAIIVEIGKIVARNSAFPTRLFLSISLFFRMIFSETSTTFRHHASRPQAGDEPKT